MKSVLFADESNIMGLTPSGENLPFFEFHAPYSGYGVPQMWYPFHRPNTTLEARHHPTDNQSLPLAHAEDRAMTFTRPNTIDKPNRAIKASKMTTALAVTPNLIFPSKMFQDAFSHDHEVGRRPFLLPPDILLEMFESNLMPVALPFSRQSSSRRTASSESRLQPTPWGDFNPVILGTDSCME
jgi:hypothetical protein